MTGVRVEAASSVEKRRTAANRIANLIDNDADFRGLLYLAALRVTDDHYA